MMGGMSMCELMLMQLLRVALAHGAAYGARLSGILVVASSAQLRLGTISSMINRHGESTHFKDLQRLPPHMVTVAALHAVYADEQTVVHDAMATTTFTILM